MFIYNYFPICFSCKYLQLNNNPKNRIEMKNITDNSTYSQIRKFVVIRLPASRQVIRIIRNS